MKNNSRPKVSVYIATSIDNYIAKNDDVLDWLENFKPPHDHPDEDYGHQAFMSEVDTIVMGRNTYKIASSVEDWPYTGKRVIVLSSTLSTVRKEAEIFNGDIPTLLNKLHAEGAKHVYVDGGMTISQFLNAGLIDSMIISIIPVILGSGISLFTHLRDEFWCKLIATKAYSNGLVQLRYEIESLALAYH